LFGSLAEQFEKLIGNHKKTDQPAADKKADDDRADHGNTITEKGGNTMKKALPKQLSSMKPEDIRALNLGDLVKKFAEGEDLPVVEELQSTFQDMTPIAAALGLGEEATVEDILAAIQAMVEKVTASAAPEGEMAKEFKKASDRIAELEADKVVRDWEDRTSEFTSIPGTAHEHAVKLAKIQTAAGKEAAEDQFAALKEANRLAAEASKSLGTSRKGTSTDFDQEVAKYQSNHTDATKAEAIKAVAKSHPDLYMARGQ
jgi:hypothetical protein